MGTISSCHPLLGPYKNVVLIEHFPKLTNSKHQTSFLSLYENNSFTKAQKQLMASSSSTIGAVNEELKSLSPRVVGENDLLIVGPGTLGRLVAEKWLEKGTVEIRPDHILNLTHYEDAASHSVAILKKKLRGCIFLGCGNHPLSRQEMMDLVAKSGKFSMKFVGFTGTNDPLGKRLNNSKTREDIGWEPKYTSFAHFLGVAE